MTEYKKRLFYAALSTGYPHPRLMVEQLTPDEYNELRQFLLLTPIGQLRYDMLATLLANILIVSNGGKGLKEPIVLENKELPTKEELEKKAIRSLSLLAGYPYGESP